MSTNIQQVQILKIDAWMYAIDIQNLLDVEALLPENSPFDDLSPRRLREVARAGGKITLTNFQWCGEFSGASFFDILPQIARKIHGTIEGVLTWESGTTNGFRIKDGKLTRHAVVMALGEEIAR